MSATRGLVKTHFILSFSSAPFFWSARFRTRNESVVSTFPVAEVQTDRVVIRVCLRLSRDHPEAVFGVERFICDRNALRNVKNGVIYKNNPFVSFLMDGNERPLAND